MQQILNQPNSDQFTQPFSWDQDKNSGPQIADLEMEIRKLKLAAEADKKLLMELQRKFQKFETALDPRCGDRSVPFHQRLANTVTGVIGLREVVDSSHVAVKITWLVLFFFGLGATIYFIYQTTVEYLLEPTATKVKLNASAYYEIPVIAICPAPWMDTDKALSLGMSLDAFKYSLGYVSTFPEIELENMAMAKSEFISFYSTRNFSSLVDYLKAVSLDLETANSTSQFEALPAAIKLSIDRKSKLLGKIFLHYQTCYAYSFAAAGRSFSSAISMSIKFQDRTNDIVHMSPDLWLHMKNNINSLLSTRAPVYALASYRTKVVISAQRMVPMSKAEKICLTDDKIPTNNYSDTYCAAECLNSKYRAVIGCEILKYSTVGANLSPATACNTMEKLRYKNQTYGEFSGSQLNEQIMNECFNACPPICDRNIYQMRQIWQQWLPTAPDQDWTCNGTVVTPPSGPNRTSYFEIYFEHQAKYDGEILTFVEVSTYSFTELINNVGGTLGLFVGATLMTFAQLILFFVEYLSSRGNNSGDSDGREMTKV